MADAKPSFMSRMRMPTKISRVPITPVPSQVEATGIAANATTSSSSSSAVQRVDVLANSEPSRRQTIAAPEERTHSNGSVRRRTPSPLKGPDPGLSAAAQPTAVTSARPAAVSLANSSNQIKTPTRATSSSAVAGSGAKSMFHSSSVIRQPVASGQGRKPVGHIMPVISATTNTQPATTGLRKTSTPGNAATLSATTSSGRGSFRAKATAASTPTMAAVATMPRTANAAAPHSSGKLQHLPKGRAPPVAAAASSSKLSAPGGKAAPANSTIASSSAALSGRKPARSASLKVPNKESPASTPPSASHNGMQSLKNRAKSLKLPGRNRHSPTTSEQGQSSATQVPVRPSSAAGDAGGGGQADVTSTPVPDKSNNVSRLAQPASKTPRFAFGFGSRSQPTAAALQQVQRVASGSIGSESSPTSAGRGSSGSDVADEKIRLMSYDHSPARKLTATHSPQDAQLQALQHSSPSEEPAFMLGSCPPAISSILESTATEEVGSESAADDDAEIQSTLTPDSTQELISVDDEEHRHFPATLTTESAKLDSLHTTSSTNVERSPPSSRMKKKLSFSPSTEFPVGLTDASPTLPYPEAKSGGGEVNMFDSIAPMSLLGPGAQKEALSSRPLSHGQAPAVAAAAATAGGRSSARVAAQKQDTIPYRVESRRRSGSAGDCILFSTRSPSPPSSPVLDHHGAMRLKSPSHSSLPRADSPQGISTSPKQTSSYFRHAVAMARTPTSSLKDARINALSGSTGSLLSTSKVKNSRSPSYVILEIEAYRQMQTEIKNLKSSLLQLKRLLQQGEDDSIGIPHNAAGTVTSSSGSQPAAS